MTQEREAESMRALAERCEKATGANHALWLSIYDTINPGERAKRFAKLTADGPYKGRLGPADMDGYVQPFGGDPTASLDAALTLVPEEYRLTSLAETIVECPNPWRAILWERKRSPKKRPFGDAATPALALTAAAIRALITKDLDNG